MALWAEIQVKKDLGVSTRKKKGTNFSKLFEMPPHATYTARDLKTAKRLRRHMNTNIMSLTDWKFMERLERRTVEVYLEDLKERMDGRARDAASAAHLRLWEEVLRGHCTLPLEHLDDPCMRDIRRQQLKLEGLQKKADKLGTTFQRVLAQPKEWSPPTDRWGRMKKREEKRRRSSAPYPQPCVDKKSADASGDVTICSLGDYYNKLGDVSHTGNLIGPAHRRKRAKSLEHDTDSQHGRESVRDSVRKSHAEEADEAPKMPRSARRVMPEKRKPVVYPAEPPRCLLLSSEGNKHVLGPPTNPDYIMPRYFVPKALDHLRNAKNLDELFVVGDELFITKYPADDNRKWREVAQNLSEAREIERMKGMTPSEIELQNL